MIPTPDSLLAAGSIEALDREFARYLERHHQAGPALQVAACLASAELRSGHAWLDLDTAPWPAGLEPEDGPAIGSPEQRRPLVREGRRIGLLRSWSAEARIAARVRALVSAPAAEWPPASPVSALARQLFAPPPGRAKPDFGSSGGDLQAAAAFLPFTGGLAVVSGGPGTGKTTTLARLLALRFAAARATGRPLPRVRLAAPTGKAAARMAESLSAAAAAMPPDSAAAFAGLEAVTLHRLLGLSTPLSRPAFHPDRPLEADVVVVDECSMVDIGMLADLLGALPDTCALILLGDRYQLPSVEAGRVLADICEAWPANAFSDEFATAVNACLELPSDHIAGGAGRCSPVVELRHSYRFSGTEAIGRVARAVNAGDPDAVLAEFAAPASGSSVCARADLPHPTTLATELERRWRPLLGAATPEEALERLGAFMCLCALHDGPWGRATLNAAVLERIGPARVRPVIITQNDPAQSLFNGYLGVVFEEKGQSLAWFSIDGKPRPYLPAFLPAHDDAFAITVHKSQGSEFDSVVLVMPESPPETAWQPSRELLYTGITRARRECLVLATEAAVAAAVAGPTRRRSGLAERLRTT